MTPVTAIFFFGCMILSELARMQKDTFRWPLFGAFGLLFGVIAVVESVS